MSCSQRDDAIRIGLLSNPLSGRNKRHFSSFRAVFQSHSNVEHAEVVTPDDISKSLAVFASRQVNLVLINGGDGTIQATLNALINDRAFPKLPLVAVLPAGTANLIAGDVGLGPYSPETITKLFEALPTLSSVHQTTRHLLRLQFSDGKEPLHGMFFGIGAIYSGTQLGRETKQSVGRLGEWGAGLIFAKFLIGLASGSQTGLQPVSAGLSIDGGDAINQKCLMLMVTTLERLFLGMKPFWNPNSGLLRYTGVTVPYRYLWRILPSVLRGKGHPLATKANGYDSQNPREIRLQLTSGFVLDGEVYDPPGHGQAIILGSGGEVSFLQLQS
ncbi:MAG TPA: diacylglycerol kinase family protein [Nitrospirales bacterium]|nr:hypothetical protein [Nitrospiraceae bacterium]HNP28167.1 diacylglycerol kinase family protein [Nitrospirales bacterium]